MPARPTSLRIATSDDRTPYVYKTADYGKTWTKIVNGLPRPTISRALFAKTRSAQACCSSAPRHGIYVSFDDGDAWQSLRLNLPVTPVHGIEVEGNDLVIATHGRSFYILDDISVLRQVTQEDDQRAGRALRARPTPRVRSRAASSIDYFLKAAADKATIDMLDAQGAIIRTFTGTSARAAGSCRRAGWRERRGRRRPRPPPRASRSSRE